jgi:hypothetical protein
MKMLQKLAWALFFSTSTYTAFAEDSLNLDFTPPEVGSYGVVFGNPTVVPTVGPLTDALVFHAVSSYEQIALGLPLNGPRYEIQYDVLTHALLNSQYAFTTLLDTPQARNMSFHGGANTIQMNNLGNLMEFKDDQLYHFKINLDFPANQWSVTIDGGQPFTTTIDAANLYSIRFSLAPWKVGAPDLPGTFVALDNVVVNVVPEPSNFALALTAGLMALGTCLRKKASRSKTTL